MIRLAPDVWLDATSTGWWVVVVSRQKGRTSTPARHGPFTSPRHVLQQRVVALPEDAQAELVALVDVLDVEDELPPAATPSPISPR